MSYIVDNNESKVFIAEIDGFKFFDFDKTDSTRYKFELDNNKFKIHTEINSVTLGYPLGFGGCATGCEYWIEFNSSVYNDEFEKFITDESLNYTGISLKLYEKDSNNVVYFGRVYPRTVQPVSLTLEKDNFYPQMEDKKDESNTQECAWCHKKGPMEIAYTKRPHTYFCNWRCADKYNRAQQGGFIPIGER